MTSSSSDDVAWGGQHYYSSSWDSPRIYRWRNRYVRMRFYWFFLLVFWHMDGYNCKLRQWLWNDRNLFYKISLGKFWGMIYKTCRTTICSLEKWHAYKCDICRWLREFFRTRSIFKRCAVYTCRKHIHYWKNQHLGDKQPRIMSCKLRTMWNPRYLLTLKGWLLPSQQLMQVLVHALLHKLWL